MIACVPYESMKPGIQKLSRKDYKGLLALGRRLRKKSSALDHRKRKTISCDPVEQLASWQRLSGYSSCEGVWLVVKIRLSNVLLESRTVTTLVHEMTLDEGQEIN
jgi:hypothetical protein